MRRVRRERALDWTRSMHSVMSDASGRLERVVGRGATRRVEGRTCALLRVCITSPISRISFLRLLRPALTQAVAFSAVRSRIMPQCCCSKCLGSAWKLVENKGKESSCWCHTDTHQPRPAPCRRPMPPTLRSTPPLSLSTACWTRSPIQRAMSYVPSAPPPLLLQKLL